MMKLASINKDSFFIIKNKKPNKPWRYLASCLVLLFDFLKYLFDALS